MKQLKLTMEKFYHKLFKNTLSTVLTIAIASLVVAAGVYATTTVGNNVSVGGTLGVTGVSTFTRATTTSATTTEYLYVGYDGDEPAGWNFAGGDLYVGGAAYFGAKATATTALAVGSPTGNYVDFASGDFIVQGVAEFDSNLFVAGTASSTSATTTAYLYVGPDITEDTNINFAGGDLVVADALNVGGVVYLDGALQATSTSLFTGAATFYSTVNVSGLTTLGAATSTSATTTAYLYVGPDITAVI